MLSQYSLKRDALLAAAQQLLHERGSPRAVNLDEVARRAGTAKATIYRYFPGKAALLAEAGHAGEEEPLARDRILDAATRVIPRLGLEGATMQRIAEEAGVSAPALYWHFKSRDDLLLAVVERLADTIRPWTWLGEPPFPDSPERTLAAFIAVAMPAQAAHLDLFRTLVVEVGNHPELAAALYDRVVSRIWGALSAFMELQAANGRFRPGHPLLRVIAMAGMVTFYNLARRNFGGRADLPPPEEAAREFLAIFLEGVLDGSRSSS